MNFKHEQKVKHFWLQENYSLPILRVLLEQGATLCSRDQVGVTPTRLNNIYYHLYIYR